MKAILECSECAFPVKAKGLCSHHYDLARRYGQGRPLCSIEGCDSNRYCKDLCCNHYNAYRKWGDPLFVGKQWKLSPEERFWQYVRKTDECWEWTGNTSRLGYGMFSLDGKSRSAHRVSYEWFVGTIPEGLEIDHLCRNRRCVRPEHLEAVSHHENVRRGINVTRLHCKLGHLLQPSMENGRPRRRCPDCDRTSKQRYQERKKLERLKLARVT